MAIEDGELKVIFDGVWSGCIGSVSIFNCLFKAMKLQPGVDPELLTSDLRAELERSLDLFDPATLAHQTVSLAHSLLQEDDV